MWGGGVPSPLVGIARSQRYNFLPGLSRSLQILFILTLVLFVDSGQLGGWEFDILNNHSIVVAGSFLV